MEEIAILVAKKIRSNFFDMPGTHRKVFLLVTFFLFLSYITFKILLQIMYKYMSQNETKAWLIFNFAVCTYR